LSNRIALAKFIEVGLRSVFIIFSTYSLTLIEAGQFGLLLTYQGVASFLFGYERYIDIQRRFVGESSELFDSAVSNALILFVVNYLLFTPFYLVPVVLFAKLSGFLVFLCILIAVGEQLLNFVYQLAMVNERYGKLMYITIVKNILMVGGLFFLFLSDIFYIHNVIYVWAVATFVSLILLAFYWLTGFGAKKVHLAGVTKSLVDQYVWSKTHFILGLVAILSLQLGRLTVGSLLPLEQVGIYFRHVLLVSLVYQVFNIAIYNRVLPEIFSMIKRKPIGEVKKIVFKEHKKVLGLLSILSVCIAGLYLFQNGALLLRFNLEPYLLLGLLIATAIQTRGDLTSLLLQGLFKEKVILTVKSVSLVLNIILTVLLTLVLGINGTVLATMIISVVYMVYIRNALGRIEFTTSIINKES
jgi:O-antigen/teichoic acid export membrane protein